MSVLNFIPGHSFMSLITRLGPDLLQKYIHILCYIGRDRVIKGTEAHILVHLLGLVRAPDSSQNIELKFSLVQETPKRDWNGQLMSTIRRL